MQKDKSKAKKPVQYFKVVNVDAGHYGLKYKIGINEDPNPIPLDKIPSCGRGAIYFTTAENLHYFNHYGSHIAWVTPISQIKADGEKFKAHKIKITKILPFALAIPLIKEIPITDWESFGINVTYDMIVNSKKLTMQQKFEWIDEDDDEKIAKFIIANKNSKELMSYIKKNRPGILSSQLLKLAEAGIYQIFEDNDDYIYELINISGSYPKFKKLVMSNPDKYLKMVYNLI